MLTRFSPAKLNLFLHITGRRDDGYHDLQSVFSAIDFGDVLNFELSDGDVPLVMLTGADHLTDDVSDNLVVKTARLLACHYPNHAKPVAIHLQKHLPTGAGLGGGSSNAATTLIALDELWKIGLSQNEMMRFARQLGADVGFFVFYHHHRCAAIAEGVGDRLTPLCLPRIRYLILMPQCYVSTQALFCHPDLKRDSPVMAHDVIRQGDFDAPCYANAFEPLVGASYSDVKMALDYLKELQAKTGTKARMTGTGSVVFLPLTDKCDDDTLRLWQHDAPCPAMVVNGLGDDEC